MQVIEMYKIIKEMGELSYSPHMQYVCVCVGMGQWVGGILIESRQARMV